MHKNWLLELLARPSTELVAPESTLGDLSALISTRAKAVTCLASGPCDGSHARAQYSLNLDDGSMLAIELRYEKPRVALLPLRPIRSAKSSPQAKKPKKKLVIQARKASPQARKSENKPKSKTRKARRWVVVYRGNFESNRRRH